MKLEMPNAFVKSANTLTSLLLDQSSKIEISWRSVINDKTMFINILLVVDLKYQKLIYRGQNDR